MEYTEEEIKVVSEVIKMYFNNLTVNQILTITFDILRKLKALNIDKRKEE